MPNVLAEKVADGVLLLRLNRPEQRNALNLATRKEIVDQLDAAAADPGIRAVVLTGDSKAFAAGADLREMADTGPVDMMQRGVHLLWDRIAAFPKPLIAAVNGYALGGGCELAMHCDIIIAGEGARFGQPEVKVGIIAGGSGTQRLMRAVGKHKAMMMLLTGDFVSAAEANEMGLVSRVVPDGDAVDTAVDMASRIAKLAPLAVQMTKEVALAGQDASLSAGLNLERKALWVLFASKDKEEGMSAFLEGRAPEFKGE